MMEIFLDSFMDSAKAFPFLYGAYILTEWIAHSAGDAFKRGLRSFGFLGSIVGALLGLVPQCGFSVAAARFFADRVITPGTLVAVFVATSDEALPIIFAEPDRLNCIVPLLVAKFLFAAVVGLFIDFALRRLWRKRWESRTELAHHHTEHEHHESGCNHEDCHGSIWLNALKKSLVVFAIIFVLSCCLSFALEKIGEEKTRTFLLSGNCFQPVIAALFGLIPNCSASVFLTKMYLEGALSFGSVVAGLSTGAGMGLLVLFDVVRDKREPLLLLLFIFVVSAGFGMLLNLSTL